VKNNEKVRRFALFAIVYNVLVILFGAFVRASGSGAGCGAHWPLCNGKVIPTEPVIETVIEFTHRITSGFSLLIVFLLVFIVFKYFPKGNFCRKAVSSALFFTILEALLGAGLVLFKLVGDNDSVIRAIVISIHLLNTFMLLGSLVLLYDWSGKDRSTNIVVPKRKLFWLVLLTISILLLSMSGAITALGDTLFPATSLKEGIQQDLSSSVHFLIELRIFHPLIAVLTIFLILAMLKYGLHINSEENKKLSNLIVVFFLLQLFLGGLNVVLLAPIWMQIIHLLVADLIWISFVLFANRVIYFDS